MQLIVCPISNDKNRIIKAEKKTKFRNHKIILTVDSGDVYRFLTDETIPKKKKYTGKKRNKQTTAEFSNWACASYAMTKCRSRTQTE